MGHLNISNAYGIGLLAVLVGVGSGIAYYQMYFIPELNAKPIIPEKILHPGGTTTIIIIPGAENQDQEQNFVPKEAEAQLGVNNLVIWKNIGDVGHTVTPDPDSKYKDPYSGDFGSPGIIMPGKTYQFLFTKEVKIKYHCEPHPWMTGEIDVVHGALTS
jgi:plastocyanin